MKFEIKNAPDYASLHVVLASGEQVVTERGAMMGMSPELKMETNLWRCASEVARTRRRRQQQQQQLGRNVTLSMPSAWRRCTDFWMSGGMQGAGRRYPNTSSTLPACNTHWSQNGVGYCTCTGCRSWKLISTAVTLLFQLAEIVRTALMPLGPSELRCRYMRWPTTTGLAGCLVPSHRKVSCLVK